MAKMIEVWKSKLKIDDVELPEYELPYYPHLLFFLEHGGVNCRSTTERGIIGYFLFDLIVNLKIAIPSGLTRNSFRATIILEGDDGEDETHHYDYPPHHHAYLKECFNTIWNLKPLVPQNLD
jgi:hypothetical protein